MVKILALRVKPALNASRSNVRETEVARILPPLELRVKVMV